LFRKFERKVVKNREGVKVEVRGVRGGKSFAFSAPTPLTTFPTLTSFKKTIKIPFSLY